MENRVGESSATAVDGGGGAKDSGSFECNICLELAQDPVVTLCGHLFCWPCLYEWLHVHAHSRECPVCKAGLEEEKLVPLYGRGKASTDPRSRSVAVVQIPSRPAGQRPATAPQPDHHHDHLPHHDPWFMGGAGAPVAGGRWGNYTFSAAIGGLFPLLSFQVHGFPQAAAYGPAAGFPYGYGHSFHGWHGHGFPHQAPQGQHVDVFLKLVIH
uniref:E3 ubiquitin-protein ligase RMA n=1 Tax=Oryza glumipatula TaxID=40148 RepID=A0A0D9YFE5_9ORYZ